MRRHTIIGGALALLVCSTAAAQGITVSSPPANVTWLKGSSYAIQWTIQNYSPPSVAILLVNPTDTTTVVTIAGSAPNPGPYQWSPIPASVPPGQYRVKVVVMNQWSGTSGVFTIAPQGQGGGTGVHPGAVAAVPGGVKVPGAVALNPVRILEPGPGQTWKLGKTFMINWTANTKPDDGFTVDLLRADGSKVRTLLDGGADKRPDGSWIIWGGAACNDPVGDYRIRVTSWYAKKGMTSAPVHVEASTKKTVQSVPVSVQNAELVYTNCGGFNSGMNCEATAATRAAVGSAGSETGSSFAWSYFRARLTFDLSPIQAKHGVVVQSATLMPGDQRTCQRNRTASWCADKLVLLRAEEVGTWNKFKVPAMMLTYPLVGWWKAPITAGGGVDITQPVRDIVKGVFHNHGFVVTGGGEGGGGCAPTQNNGILDDASCSYMCITNFTPIMYVTYTENLCDQ